MRPRSRNRSCPKLRLPRTFVPASYAATLSIDPARDTFDGVIAITGEVKDRTPVIWLHGKDLAIKRASSHRCTAPTRNARDTSHPTSSSSSVTYAIAGFHQDGPRQVDMFLWNWRGLDVINAHDREPAAYVSGMAAAVDGILSGHLDPTPLYTHRVPLARAGEAFEALRTRPAGFIKAMVTP
jgi:threonine dehydrogenase-like Zn-dependent dehydrogenase